MPTSKPLIQAGIIALVLAWIAGSFTFAQDSRPSRSGQSLRSLLGLPGTVSEPQPVTNGLEQVAAELEEPLLMPASRFSGAVANSGAVAPLAPRYEFQDSLRSQTQQQLANFMRPISEVSLDIRELDVRLPRDRSSELQNYVTNDWTVTRAPELAVWWAAPNLRYGQLYFEDVALERYGQTCGPYWQVTGSAAHLFCSAWAVPFQMWTAPAGTCDTPLGYCRPGSYTDLYRQRFIFWR